MMPAEVNKRLKSGATFYFVWKGDRWVAEIKEEPQEGFQIPTEFAGRKRAGCVVMRSNDNWVRGLCQVRTVVDLAYDKEEKHAGKNGLAELFFPRKPSWRWPLSVESGTPFYFEQIESHGKKLVICRAIYSTDQTQMIASKTTSPPLCD